MHFLNATSEVPATARNQLIISLVVLGQSRQLWTWDLGDGTQVESIDSQNDSIDREEYGGKCRQKSKVRTRREFLSDHVQETHRVVTLSLDNGGLND